MVTLLILFILATLVMVFEQRKQLDGRGLFGSIMFLQIQLEIAVIILLPLWESVEASTTYIKASTVLQSSLTVCLNLVSLCWDSSSASSASSTSTNSLLNLGLPSRAFASLSFLKWLFTREQIISKSFVLSLSTTPSVKHGNGQEGDHRSYITPTAAWLRHCTSVLSREKER